MSIHDGKPYPWELDTRGHVWRTEDDGSVDIFALYTEGDAGYHNGPACVKCFYSFCMHCHDMPDEDCEGPLARRRWGRQRMMPTLTPAITFPRNGIAPDAQLDDVIAGHVLWCEVGSTMYGIGTGTDDRDEMVVFVEPPHIALGLDGYETIVRRSKAEGVRSEAGDLDVVAHTLRKFVRLAAGGNPSILAALWCPDSAVMAIGSAGAELRRERDVFSTNEA